MLIVGNAQRGVAGRLILDFYFIHFKNPFVLSLSKH